MNYDNKAEDELSWLVFITPWNKRKRISLGNLGLATYSSCRENTIIIMKALAVLSKHR